MPSGPNVEILLTDTPQLFERAIERASRLLRAGEVVAIPTETVYGLAANALDPKAVSRIYEIKGRPASNPLIVHVADLAMARQCVAAWPESATRVVKAFWPGPLTLVLERSDTIPKIVTAGGPTVAIRWPAHPFAQQLIRACGFPVAAPSANRSNEVSPTNAEHVRKDLGDRVPLIVDGGQSQVGIESTVLDLTVTPPRVLRPGIIHRESLAAVLGKVLAGTTGGSHARSPGLHAKHYSPRARLAVCSWQNDSELQQQLRNYSVPAAEIRVLAHTRIPAGLDPGTISVIPHDPEAFARALYGELRRCDDEGASLIVVEAVPDRPEWEGIADRLHRAGERANAGME